MSRRDIEEQRRCQVERLLATDLSVTEWSKRNGISRATMYNRITVFAKSEPELFGGPQNIVDTAKRNWLDLTRKNTALSKTLSITTPSTEVLLIDNDPSESFCEISYKTTPKADISAICVTLQGAHVEVPPGASITDIENVIKAVATL